MNCVLCRMITKWFRDTWKAIAEYWWVGVVITLVFAVVFTLTFVSVTLSLRLFGNPDIICGGFAILYFIMVFGYVAVTGLWKRYKEARDFCGYEEGE